VEPAREIRRAGRVLSLGAGLIMPFVALYLKEHVGATVAQVGLIQGAMAVAMAMAVLAAPLVARRFGPIARSFSPRCCRCRSSSRSLWQHPWLAWRRSCGCGRCS